MKHRQRIFLSTEVVDMRGGFDRLAGRVRGAGLDLYAGHLFVFVSRRRTHAKVLTWDGTGMVVTYKRLGRGRFTLPVAKDPSRTVCSMHSSFMRYFRVRGLCRLFDRTRVSPFWTYSTQPDGCDPVPRMTTPATVTIVALDEWLTTQPPWGRAMAQPMVTMVSEVLVSQQAQLDTSLQQTRDALTANRTLEQKLHAVISRVDALEKKPFTPTSERTRKSERTPDARREARKRTRKEMSPEERAALRAEAARKRQAKLDALPTVTVTVDLPSTYPAPTQHC
ncbi:MAG: hypothetical protein ACJAZO_003889 [Myxococcota bacterium]